MKLSPIFNQILSEDVKLAEKLLNNINYDLNSPNFLEFKQQLIKDNRPGLIGIIVKFVIGMSGSFYIDTARRIYNQIVENESIIKSMPKNIYQYQFWGDFLTDLKKQIRLNVVKKLTNRLTNKTIKDALNQTASEEDNDFDYILSKIKEFLQIPSPDQKEFLSKSDKYRDLDVFITDMINFIDDTLSGFKYENVIRKIKSMSPEDIRIVYNENNILMARIITFKASSQIGSESWCIVGDEENFNNYTANGKNFQYFLFNFNENVEPNEKMIGFTVDDNNKIVSYHDRYDDQFPNINQYLNDLGISSKIILISQRERIINRLQTMKTPEVYVTYNEDDVPLNLNDYENKKMSFSIKFLKELPTNQPYRNLDLIFKKFQGIKFNMNKKYYDKEKITKYTETVNVIPYTINHLKELIGFADHYYNDDYKIDINLDTFIYILKKVYISNINLLPDTKSTINYFLKENGVDILKLNQIAKEKQNKPLSDMEFTDLKNRGENFKPEIQNKLALIRKGENVNLSIPEVNYAIDNGMENIIRKYYTKLIPSFYHEQLDYDNMKVYKKLNLLDKVAPYIKKKGNTYGIDSLNSIEKSIFDYY